MNAVSVRAIVRSEREKDVAVIVIDNPPINAGSQEVRSGLLAAIEEARADSQVSAVVIIGGGTTFISGSDLREFGKPIADPQWPEVFAAIETCEKPVVAGLHGAALGGGFELAMACDARVALFGTVVGLPEVTLGIIPGAGGTQRLPRLVGIPRAIAMIASGSMQGRKRKVRDLVVPACDEASIARASESALRAGKDRPAVRAAIDAVISTGFLSIDDGLAQERALFQTLRTSREARALRHQFFAEREAAKQPGIDISTARPVMKVAVIGAGTMGGGIAIALLDAGYDVVLIDQEDASLTRGVNRIISYYSGRANAGKISSRRSSRT